MQEPNDTQTTVNDSETSGSIDTGLTQPRSRPVRSGKVYFIRADDAIKIGFSMDPKGRLAELQVGSIHKLELLGSMDGTRSDEGELHERFAHIRKRGEWFDAAPDLLAFVASLHERQIVLRQPQLSGEAKALIRQLINLRVAHGGESPIGHHCSNLVEQIGAMATYQRPKWASHEMQTLPWLMNQQMKGLEALLAEHRRQAN